MLFDRETLFQILEGRGLHTLAVSLERLTYGGHDHAF